MGVRNKKNKNKKLSAAVIFILVIALGALAYFNRGLFQLENIGSASVFSFETGQHYQFDAWEGRILALNSEGLTCINQNGKQPWKISRQLSKPSMQTAGSYTVLFDRGGRDIAAYSAGAMLWEKKTDQPIITAKINEKGYCAVVTYEIGYKGKIEVSNSKGELVYSWKLGENYIVDVDISPDCKFFAAATVLTASSGVASKVTVVDIDAESILGEVQREDSLVMSIKYQKNGMLYAIAEGELIGISPKGEQRWVVGFEGRQLQKFKLPYNTSFVLSFVGSRNNSIVEIYNTEGRKTGEYISESEIKAMDVKSGEIIVSQQKKVMLLNLKGRVVAQAEAEREIRSVLLLPDKKAAVVLGGSVEIIKL